MQDHNVRTRATLSQELLNEFKSLWRVEFGEEVEDEIALARALAIVDITRAIHRAIPVDKQEIYTLRRKCYNDEEPPMP